MEKVKISTSCEQVDGNEVSKRLSSLWMEEKEMKTHKRDSDAFLMAFFPS